MRSVRLRLSQVKSMVMCAVAQYPSIRPPIENSNQQVSSGNTIANHKGNFETSNSNHFFWCNTISNSNKQTPPTRTDLVSPAPDLCKPQPPFPPQNNNCRTSNHSFCHIKIPQLIREAAARYWKWPNKTNQCNRDRALNWRHHIADNNKSSLGPWARRI